MRLFCASLLLILPRLQCYGREIKDCSNSIGLSLMEDDFLIETKGCNVHKQQHCLVNIKTMRGNYLKLWFTAFSVPDKMPYCLSNFVEIFIG